MARPGAYLAAFLLLAGTVCAQSAPTIPADTRLIVRVAATVTSRTAQVGDIVETILVEHRPPMSGRDAGRAFLEPGTRVAGVVEHVRRAERGKVGAELRIVFREVGGGATPILRTDARVLVAGRRYELAPNGALTVRVVERAQWAEGAIFFVPMGAGMGLLAGRRGWTAATGAAVGFLWWYLPSKLGTTNDRFADVELKPGDRLGLYIR